VRAFLAIELTDPIRQRLAEAQENLRPAAEGVKWVAPEKIHLTLKFLGEIEEDAVPAITDAVAEVAGRIEPFHISVESVGAFPPRGKPRVIWAGIAEDTGRLADLQRQTEAALKSLGFKPEKRRWTPHATIGRVKKRRGSRELRPALDERQDDRFGAQPVTEIVLFRSDLFPAGAVYTPLRRIPLGQRPEPPGAK
jgi:2'-5' RNA ligase